MNTYIQPVHKIIHVLCLMNFHIVLTSNWIIRLQMIGNMGDTYEMWWKLPNSTHAHSPKAINNTWTNMYTVLWKMKTFVNTLSLLFIILSEFMADKFTGSRLLMLSNIWNKWIPTSLDFNFFKGRLLVFYHIIW